MRNIVSISDIPPDLHQWLKDEADRQAKATNKRVCLYHVVIRACEEYRARVEAERGAESPEPVGVSHG